MKILHVCMACTYTEGFTYQENYLSKYHAQKHETYLITNKYMFEKGEVTCSSDTKYTNADGVHVIRLENRFAFIPSKFQSYVGKYKKFYSVIDEIDPDIIFVHNCQFNDVKLIAKYCRKKKHVKLFVDNHADFSNSAKNWLSKNVIHGIMWKNCANKINPYVIKFFGVLPARVDFLINVYGLPQDKCELLVMGADDEFVAKASDEKKIKDIRMQYNVKEDELLLVTGGKIDLFKQQTLTLMRAINNMENAKVKLVVFGSVAAELMEQLSMLVDNKRVFYAGWMSAEESYYVFGAADLVVFPGRHSVYWEQVVGQGIPMLCKYWEGTTHVDLGGNVRFLEDDSIDEITRNLIEIIENKDVLQGMKRVGNSELKQNFLYSKISEKAILS